MTKDLTSGSPTKSIISFTIPIMFGNLFQQAYNMTDIAIVGKFVGKEALAGVGSTASVNFLIIGFLTGTCAGFGVRLAQAFGANDYKKLRKFYTNSFWISAILAVALTVLTLIFIEPILTLMQTPLDMFPYAKTYISTIFAGIPGIFLYNLLSNVLRSIGDSKTPLFFLVFAAIVNVLLDLLFVLVFNMGVLGTGLATIISQSTSGVLCLLLIKKKFAILNTQKGDWAIDAHYIKKLLGIGIPMGLQFSITAIGTLVIQSAINTLGTAACAAVTAASKISFFATQGLEALGLTMATYTGQNLGAKNMKRISKGVNRAVLISIAYCIFFFVVLHFTIDYISLLFVDSTDIDVISKISTYVFANSSLFFFVSLVLIFRNTIQGLGFSNVAMIGGLIEMLARSFVAIIIVPQYGFNGAVFSNPSAWITAALFLVPTYFYVMKKTKGRLKNERIT